MRSYKPEELFDLNGKLRSELADLAPKGLGAWAPIPMPTAVFCSKI